LDYVSCSPFRVPVARLEAGRAAVNNGTVAVALEGGRASRSSVARSDSR
jgi:pyruvate,orthophosphate dikinase